jgi:hypothetical protein
MANPFITSRRNARRTFKNNLSKKADQVNEMLASGTRSLVFPPGFVDVAAEMLCGAGGWVATVKDRGDESARVVVREDPDVPRRDDDCPFISLSTARARSLEYVGKSATKIVEQLGNGVRVFIEPLGIADDLVKLLNEPGTGWKAEVQRRDEEDQMVVRFLVTESDESESEDPS